MLPLFCNGSSQDNLSPPAFTAVLESFSLKYSYPAKSILSWQQAAVVHNPTVLAWVADHSPALQSGGAAVSFDPKNRFNGFP